VQLAPISVRLPDKRTMQNTHEGYLTLHKLPPKACKTYLFDDMQESSLVSIRQLCDAGCIATFTKDDIFIKKDDDLILQGTRDPATGMWTANISHQPGTPNVIQHVAMSAIAAETIGERIAFLHACAGSPALSKKPTPSTACAGPSVATLSTTLALPLHPAQKSPP
jgi:hypothetical protein